VAFQPNSFVVLPGGRGFVNENSLAAGEFAPNPVTGYGQGTQMLPEDI
jgi:hypothetical protein